jgi:hypothetical protein
MKAALLIALALIGSATAALGQSVSPQAGNPLFGQNPIVRAPWASPADPLAGTPPRMGVTLNTAVILKYLQLLALRQNAYKATGAPADHELISGQVAGGSYQALYPNDESSNKGPMVRELQAEVGQTPGLIGFDYDDYQKYNPGFTNFADQTDMNNDIMVWGQGRQAMPWTPASSGTPGSLIEITFIAQNPYNHHLAFSNLNESDNDPTGYASCIGHLADITDHSTPGSVGAHWKQQLIHAANGLALLQDQGITVLWRPFAEATGENFWWGFCKPSPADYQAMWADMKDFFENFKSKYGGREDIHNLLWVYAQTTEKEPMSLFPTNCNGERCVDILGVDDYTDASYFPYYGNMVDTGNVVVFAERGNPRTTIEVPNTPVYVNLPNEVQNSYPHVVLFQAYPSDHAIINNQPNALNDPTNPKNQPPADPHSANRIANQNDVQTDLACVAGAISGGSDPTITCNF